MIVNQLTQFLLICHYAEIILIVLFPFICFKYFNKWSIYPHELITVNFIVFILFLKSFHGIKAGLRVLKFVGLDFATILMIDFWSIVAQRKEM